MTLLLGNLGLAMAMLAATIALMAALAAARLGSAAALRTARISLISIFALFTLAAMTLMGALIDSDFHLAYVARFTERALPTGYKMAAFWAGQEGSLLLWGWLIALMAVLATLVNWKKTGSEQAISTAMLALICGFFAALMLFAANPFAMLERVPADGHGLNPMLQDPGMIAHPPFLLLGYAGFAIPFAMMFGALCAGCKNNHWLDGIRRWTVAAWLFLTIGILLGAQWAYIELGWGGYWAWDPVENASLLPWLTGTALLHSIMVQQQRGMLKVWNAVLIALTFILCIFGTYITRSGVVDSVHSFGKSLVGTFFLVFLLANIVLSAALIFARRRLLKPEYQIETIVGREGAFVVMNVLFLIMTAVTLAGTTFPLISSLFGNSVSVGQPFYNKVVVPMGLCLMALMALGPLLTYGKGAPDHLKKHILPPLVGGASVALALALIWRIFNPWALLATLIVGTAAVSTVWDLLAATFRRAHNGHETLAMALVHTIDGNHRRYGGQTIHIGMLMIMVGIAGSSLYNVKHTVQLTAGAASQVAAGWSAKLEKVEQIRGENYDAVDATIRVRDPAGNEMSLRPQRRFYDKSADSNSQVANWSTWRRDAYLTLAGWQDGGRQVAIEMIVNPLVAWLWIGGVVMTAGGVLCLLPRLIPHRSAAKATASAKKNVRNLTPHPVLNTRG